MGTPGNRKQRYVLDIDDVVRDGFMTQANAEALIRGINASGGTVKLAVPYGGTGNETFTDQQLLKYDATTNTIISAGFTGVLPGGNTVFIPRETGTIYTQNSTDKITNSAIEMEITRHSEILPPNSQWSDLMLTFQFELTYDDPTMTGLRILFGDDAIESTDIIAPEKTILYEAGVAPDSRNVTWIAMGQIPLSHAFDNPLVVRLMGVPLDRPDRRTVISRISYRGVVPEPPAGGQKGIPVFLPTPITVVNTTSAVAWTTFDASTYIPSGASAVILHVIMGSNEQGQFNQVLYRSQSGAFEYTIAAVSTNNDEDDQDFDSSQRTLPFKELAGIRTFDYRIQANANFAAGIAIVGYVT